MNTLRTFLLAACVLQAAPPAVAAPAPTAAGSLPIDVLPWADPASGPTAHDSVDLVGRGRRAGRGWWALACEQTCRLQPLALAQVEAVTIPLQYSGETPGQRLRFAPAPPRGTLLLFHPLRPVLARHPLKAGPVPSGYPVGRSPAVRAADDSPDATAALVNADDDQPWRLAPTLLRPAARPGEPAPSDDSSQWPISLDLNVGRHHQSLGLIGSCGDLGWRRWLLWAGDLDGDGRPDFVVQLDLSLGNEVVLYLSSLARRGEWVGEAGHSNLEREGEC
jgi:hypothetical protein